MSKQVLLPLFHLQGLAATIITLTKDLINAVNQQEAWFDNELYQWDNKEEACKYLGIKNLEHPKIDSVS
ncbi:hypothetical protein VTN96DRAFT_8046 [Rasamsonia emersonii]